MADNRQGYGFRFAGSRYGQPTPTPIRLPVVSGQAFSINGGTANVNLGPGDPVLRLASGAVTLCDGAEGAGGALTPYGVVMEVFPFFNAGLGVMTPAEQLPSATVYGTNLERQSFVGVVPFELAYWEIDCMDNTTATTVAAYQLFQNENANYRLRGGISPAANPQNRAHPRLDISSHATTNTLVLRVVKISESKDNVDVTGNFWKVIVELNIGGTSGAAAFATTSTGV